jgi:hypothetical protein
MATQDEIRVAAIALMHAEGWVYVGIDILIETDPRSRRWVASAKAALKAAESVRRKAAKKAAQRGEGV